MKKYFIKNIKIKIINKIVIFNSQKTFKKFYYLIKIKYLFFIRTKRQAKINREEISPFIFNTLHYLII